jgi:hypothetical protein
LVLERVEKGAPHPFATLFVFDDRRRVFDAGELSDTGGLRSGSGKKRPSGAVLWLAVSVLRF